jgi:hypothetical protein
MPASSWRFEGLEECIHLLGPMLTEAQQWEVVRSIVKRLDERDDTSVTSLVDDLDGWSLAIASEARVRQGIEVHLRTQASWLPPGRRLRRPELDAALEPVTWLDFAVDCVLETLGSDSGVLNQAAMRAMLVLSRLLPSAFDSFLQKAAQLPRPDREAIAQFAEHVAATAPAEFARFDPFLKHCEESRCFELEVQAWIARCAFARATGEQSPNLDLACHHRPPSGPSSPGSPVPRGTRWSSSGRCQEFARPGRVQYVRAADETKEGPVSSWTLVYGQRMDSRYGVTVPEPEAVVQFSSFRAGWTTYSCSS